MEKRASLSERDAQLIWHPFTQMLTASPNIAIVRAEGTLLYADDGTCYLDAISSWWVNLHGHAHPAIAEKIAQQARTLEHVIFAGFTHPGAVLLAERLTTLTGMNKLFYSDNGSTAVETALKMALQYWHNRSDHTQRKQFLSLKNGYHGETFGAMSVSGKNPFQNPFRNHLFPGETLEAPFPGKEEQFLKALTKALASPNLAAFIFEPAILGVGGMKIYSTEALDEGIGLCKENGVLTIADEVMTGFGRTGPLFVCDTLKNKPDILCLSKGITGGFLPLGATLCTETIYQAFLSPSLEKGLLHGHSYTANPLAIAGALASLDLLLLKSCHQSRERIATSHRHFCQRYQGHPSLLRCESIGTLLILEYRTQDPSDYLNPLRDRLYHYFLRQGILLRPFGNTIHVVPPYCITQEQLLYIYKHLVITLETPP